MIDNIAPVAANIGVGERLEAFGSIIGPANVDVNGGEAQPTETQLRRAAGESLGLQRRHRRVVRPERHRRLVAPAALGPLA